MRDSDWSRQILLRSDWLLPIGAIMTTHKLVWTLKTFFLYIPQAFTIVSKAKEDYDRKRDKLLEYYTKSEAILTEACKGLPVLQKFIDNFEKRIEHLKQKEYFLFVTGTTNLRFTAWN